MLCFIFTIILIQLCSCQTYDYGIAIDAGSTHTGMFIYRWDKRVTTYSAEEHMLLYPETKPYQIHGDHMHAGPVSDYIENPTNIHDLIQPLIDFAKTQLKSEEPRWGTFPILLGATAGVRSLETEKRINLMQAIRDFFSSDSVPFLYRPENVIILSGNEEGYYGWLSSNYFYNRLAAENSPTLGALDMGGASMQVTWQVEPSFDILEGCSVVQLWDETYRLYTHSFQGFGAQLAHQSVTELIGVNSVMHPCYLPYEHPFNVTIDGEVYSFQGSGDLDACIEVIRQFLDVDASCSESPFGSDCTMTGVYYPLSAQNNVTFALMSTFAYNQNDLESLGYFNNSTLHDMKELRLHMFNMTYSELKQMTPNVPDTYLSMDPFEMVYIIEVLQALGFDESSKFIFNKDLDWTTGDILINANSLDSIFIPNKAQESGSLVVWVIILILQFV